MVEKPILYLARRIPYGGFRVVHGAARVLRRLRDYPISLTLLPGLMVRADLSESVWYPLWRYGHYPHQLCEDRIVTGLLRPGDVVWDIGANIGYTALLFLHALRGRGQVVCFEPSLKSFTHLRRTLEGRPGVSAHNIAISNRVGKIRFRDKRFLNLSGVAGPGDAGSYEVPARTLDDYLAESGGPAPTLLKVDVEGHEREVFAGGAELIKEYRPIIEYESLTVRVRQDLEGQLARLSGGAYAYYYFCRDGRLVPKAQANLPGCTNNCLAIAEKDADRVASALVTNAVPVVGPQPAREDDHVAVRAPDMPAHDRAGEPVGCRCTAKTLPVPPSAATMERSAP